MLDREVMIVLSWPLFCEPVPTNMVKGLFCRAPELQWPPVASHMALNCRQDENAAQDGQQLCDECSVLPPDLSSSISSKKGSETN